MAIIGLASFGRMNGEMKENSGIGSNGLTAARHLLLHPDYRTRYPESYSSSMDPMLAYCGNWHLTDPLPGSELSVGEALLSPTRSFLPVIKTILKAMPLSIAALIHCTGGGQAKCRDFGHQIRYVKDNLFPAPPLFEALRETGQIDEKELYQVFNMGHRMELVCQPEEVDRIRSICGTFELETRVIGYTEANTSAFEGNEVIIKDRGQTHVYRSRGAAEPA
jgi:phosphoribosylformylglycinamidine cyclo-ligase